MSNLNKTALVKRAVPDIPMILLAEPEEAIRESIEMILIEEGYDCHAVSNTQSLMQSISIHNSNLIIADVHTIYNNIEEILEIQNHYSNFPPFLVTLSYEQVRDMLYLMKFGITEYLIKPFQFDEMTNRIRHILDLHTSNRTS